MEYGPLYITLARSLSSASCRSRSSSSAHNRSSSCNAPTRHPDRKMTKRSDETEHGVGITISSRKRAYQDSSNAVHERTVQHHRREKNQKREVSFHPCANEWLESLSGFMWFANSAQVRRLAIYWLGVITIWSIENSVPYSIIVASTSRDNGQRLTVILNVALIPPGNTHRKKKKSSSNAPTN